MAIFILDFPIRNGGSFHSYVSLLEGNMFLTIWVCLKIGYIPNEIAI